MPSGVSYTCTNPSKRAIQVTHTVILANICDPLPKEWWVFEMAPFWMKSMWQGECVQAHVTVWALEFSLIVPNLDSAMDSKNTGFLKHSDNADDECVDRLWCSQKFCSSFGAPFRDVALRGNWWRVFRTEQLKWYIERERELHSLSSWCDFWYTELKFG